MVLPYHRSTLLFSVSLKPNPRARMEQGFADGTMQIPPFPGISNAEGLNVAFGNLSREKPRSAAWLQGGSMRITGILGARSGAIGR